MVQQEASDLGLDTVLEDKVVVLIVEAEQTQVGWIMHKNALPPPPAVAEIPLLTQELVVDMADVEQAVASVAGMRAVSSDVPSVASLDLKISKSSCCRTEPV